jgi:hypothetical protein
VKVSTNLSTKCKHCGKRRGDHLSRSLHCPIGRKTRIGIIAFHKTQRFEPHRTVSKLQKAGRKVRKLKRLVDPSRVKIVNLRILAETQSTFDLRAHVTGQHIHPDFYHNG